MKNVLTPKHAAASIGAAIVAVLAIAALDLIAFRWLDVAALSVLRHLPPSVGPVWLAAPRFVVFAFLGALFFRWARGSLVLGAGICTLLIVLYFLFIRFGGGIWFAPDWYSRLMVFVPIAAAPVGFVLGVWGASRFFRRRDAGAHA